MLRDATIRSVKEKVGDAQFFGTFEVAYPVYDCELEIRMLALEKLSAIEEFVLHAVNLGVATLSGVELVLGLGLPATRRAVAELLGADLIGEDWSANGESRYKITDVGKEALDKAAIQKVIVIPLPCIVDGISQDVTAKPKLARYVGPEKLAELDAIVIPARHDAPTVDAFDTRSLNTLLRKLARRDPERWPQGDILDLQKVARSQRRYRLLDIVVFRARNKGEWIPRVFERHAEQRALEKVITELLRSNALVLPLETAQGATAVDAPELSFLPPDLQKEARESSERVLLLEEQIAAVESEAEAAKEAPAQVGPTTKERLVDLELRVAQLREEKAGLETQLEKGVVRVETAEHRVLLERAFKHAKEQIIIISPWLAREVVVGLESAIREAITRGVWIRIGWGFSDETRDQVKEKASKEMADYLLSTMGGEQRTRTPEKGGLQIVRLGNSHEKVLVVDTNFCVVTSFNWLSFRADPKRKHRRETGVRIGVPAHVAAFREEFERVISRAATNASVEPN